VTVLRLTQNTINGSRTRIRLDGRLDIETAPALHALVRELGPGPLALDLSGLASLDHDGLAALIALRTAGHELQGGSLYINRLLKEALP